MSNVDAIERCTKPTSIGATRPTLDLSEFRRTGLAQGQSLVEFVITLMLALIVLIVTIQFAIIGDTALAVTQLAYAGARYAAFNPNYDYSTISGYMKTVASPAINESSGANLRITLTPGATPRTIGSSVQVSVVYNLRSKLFLPNPFLGIRFPTTLSGIQTTIISR